MAVIAKADLDDLFDQLLGQTYTASMSDRAGCSMGRHNSTWLSPQLVTQIVDAVLELSDVEVRED